MRSARRLVLALWRNVEKLLVPLPCCGLLYAADAEWWSAYSCRRDLNVLSMHISTYYFHHIVAETGFGEAI